MCVCVCELEVNKDHMVWREEVMVCVCVRVRMCVWLAYCSISRLSCSLILLSSLIPPWVDVRVSISTQLYW